MRLLVTAPYVGEIGWELMSWQARVRAVFRHGTYDRVIVLGAPGKEAFYEGMPLHYECVDLRGVPGTSYEDRRYLPDRRAIVAAHHIRSALEALVERLVREWREIAMVDVLWPSYDGHIHPCTRRHQAFIQYGAGIEASSRRPQVVLVQRQRSLAAENNWPGEHWDDLGRLLNTRGIHTLVYPSNADEAIQALASSDLAVGGSTGGLHLASLCGCPHVVWSCDDQTRWTPWQITNRQRYETFWNPLGTPVEYHATQSHPEPQEVADWVMGALERIGRRTGSRVSRYKARAGWQVRRQIASRTLSSRLFRCCPWPVQEWVRYGVL
jgi:hypothetical protein